jgi:DNA polymerase-1
MCKVVFDAEANGLFPAVDTIHCIVVKEVGVEALEKVTPGHIQTYLDNPRSILNAADLLIGHNIIGYDFKLFRELARGWTNKAKVFDTMIMSMLLNPNRPMPFDCPKSILNKETGVRKKIGPHSLAAWGYRVGRGKVEHDDWSVFTPAMMHRCVEDVEITELVYLELLKEMKE